MIEEQYVSFEVAKLLKEKGFDEDINLWYDENSEMFFRHKYDINCDWRVRQGLEIYQCPNLQMAMKWLREVHNICCEICCYREKDESGFVFCFLVLPLNSQAFYQTSKYSTYEDATQAAIKYCLEHLID